MGFAAVEGLPLEVRAVVEVASVVVVAVAVEELPSAESVVEPCLLLLANSEAIDPLRLVPELNRSG